MEQFRWWIYSKESQQCINAFFKQWSSRCCSDEVYKKFCIVSEEYVTNFFKYARKNATQSSWFIGKSDRKCFIGGFYDNGLKFNPFEKVSEGLGLRLMTSLLGCRYRRMNGFNCFRFYVTGNNG